MISHDSLTTVIITCVSVCIRHLRWPGNNFWAQALSSFFLVILHTQGVREAPKYYDAFYNCVANILTLIYSVSPSQTANKTREFFFRGRGAVCWWRYYNIIMTSSGPPIYWWPHYSMMSWWRHYNGVVGGSVFSLTPPPSKALGGPTRTMVLRIFILVHSSQWGDLIMLGAR